MSVLIKGMEMPTEGCHHTICIYADGTVSTGGRAYMAVPVPPHGDLIDQDAYRDEFMNGVYELCSDDPDNYRANAIIDLFDSAPIVIPAEEATQNKVGTDVPVSPHGRLIDADALMRHCVMLPRDGGSLPVVYASYLRNAPTIIPAEETLKEATNDQNNS